MTQTAANLMGHLVDSQVKNKALHQHQVYPSLQNNIYNRHVLIDDAKESRFIKSALKLAFEDGKTWKKDKKNAFIQNKLSKSTKRKVFKISCINHTNVTFMDFYNYLECGYNGVAEFDIANHIDSNHDVLYQKVISPVSKWILQSRDFQCIRMRYYIPKYKVKGKIYTVMGTLWYPLYQDHPLYIKIPNDFIRIVFKFGARVIYQSINSTDNSKWNYVALQHSYKSGGWIPNFIEDHFGLGTKNIKYFHDICQRLPDELKQREHNINSKVSKPLLQDNVNQNNDVNHVNIVDTPCDDIDQKQNDIKNALNTNHEEIRIWLKDEVNLEEYYDILIKNGFEDFNLIQGLTLNTMESIGINKIGHRIKLMKCINNLEGNMDNNDNYIEHEEGDPQNTDLI